jgi:predicted MPP superfamily phosphohydrolase
MSIMSALSLLVLALAAFGHVAFWVAVVNRWHATGFARWIVKSVTLVYYAALAAPLAWVAWQSARSGPTSAEFFDWQPSAVTAYLAFCAAFGTAHLIAWGRWRWRRQPAVVEISPPRVVDLARHLGAPPRRGPRAALFDLVPGNQLWQLHVCQASVRVARLARELDGLSICHWSDLHLCGRIDRGYFREIVRLTNETPSDVLALTGDVCDSARYIDWIVDLFAAANARLGKYFILGNHDLRTGDVGRLRAAMREAGFVDLGGRAVAIADGRVILAGDERPWFAGEPQLPELDPREAEPLKVLLAHTPDRLRYARAHGFDLMLAGHTHGGQIRFPLVGPVLCPSWHGTRYAGGFYHEPPTLLHVSRGTASLFPLRWGCPPEFTRLVMRAGAPPASQMRAAPGFAGGS